MPTAEQRRLHEDRERRRNWKRWGPYLSERQWGTVREDYSPDGNSWGALSHENARSRAYRWGEDGLLGITDRQCRLCFALALWNGQDPFLKERLFGLTNSEGNHGEDVKEYYYYLDALPTSAYLKALYKYPHACFPYEEIRRRNSERGLHDREFELIETGVFDQGRYFDIEVEYAKADTDDILIVINASNRGPDPAPLHILPTLWFRNSWSWGRQGEGYTAKPSMSAAGPLRIRTDHTSLGTYFLELQNTPGLAEQPMLWTENETNRELLFGDSNSSPYVKDAFHRYVVNGDRHAINPSGAGTKAAFLWAHTVAPGSTVTLNLRLWQDGALAAATPFEKFQETVALRRSEADAYYDDVLSSASDRHGRTVSRQAAAGLLFSKQFYYYSVKEWSEGDPGSPAIRHSRRNQDWEHLYNRDIISMPDKWEYPWYAAWDLAFHMIPMAHMDPDFAKEQLTLLLREWYMHANGQIPAYEWCFSDVNPPVHAWACWRVYKLSGKKGSRDVEFLASAFHKLLINFTWWVNRKDLSGRNLFSGGFLGLDNIGLFDRSQPLPIDGTLEQADGTAWMAFFCGTMLSMALELARFDKAYEGVASKFFEHFVAITDAVNTIGGRGLWDEQDGFYYDRIRTHSDGSIPLKVRSLVGIMPLCAVEVLDDEVVDNLPSFRKRMQWFLNHRGDLAKHIAYLEHAGEQNHGLRLLAIPSRSRLRRMLRRVLDEREFLSPFGIRSLSRIYADHPYSLTLGDKSFEIRYNPGESDSRLFGGNSNWRGPIWFPVNYLIIEALERYFYFFGTSFKVECPTGSGVMMNLGEVAYELTRRLTTLYSPLPDGTYPYMDQERRFATDPFWSNRHLFYEYFHGDTGAGLGASHQTGWTALIFMCFEKLARRREHLAAAASFERKSASVDVCEV